MTTNTWIEVGCVLFVGAIVLASLPELRKMRSKLARQSLPKIVSQCVIWTLLGKFIVSDVLSVMYFATVGVIFVPTIIWILRLPKDDHVA